MDKLNERFNEYKQVMGDTTSSDNQREIALNSYLHERRSVHYEVLKKETELWSSLVTDNDAKALWSKIDWKGNYTRKKPSRQYSSFKTFSKIDIHVKTVMKM